MAASRIRWLPGAWQGLVDIPHVKQQGWVESEKGGKAGGGLPI